jgi:hypothetical protein
MVNAYYGGPKNAPKKSISMLFLVLSSPLKNGHLPKMVTFINIDILNKNFNLHFDHTTYGKVAQDL